MYQLSTWVPLVIIFTGFLFPIPNIIQDRCLYVLTDTHSWILADWNPGSQQSIFLWSFPYLSVMLVPVIYPEGSSSSSRLASMTPYHAHYWVVVVLHPRTAATRSLDSVLLIISVCHFVPPPSFPACHNSRGIPSSSLIDPSPSESSAAAAALFFSPFKSRTACYHHRRYTLAPGLRAVCSQRSIIGCVTIYCVTMFWLLVMYVRIPLKTASTIAFSNDGYSQLPPPCLLGCLTVSRCANLCWKLLMARSILGVSNHVSAQNNNTDYVTALNKCPYTFGFYP